MRRQSLNQKALFNLAKIRIQELKKVFGIRLSLYEKPK